jgi:cytochrome c556
MREIALSVLVFASVAGFNTARAAEEMMHHGDHHMAGMDKRTSLGLAAPMKQHQLSNMREHVAAIKSIVGLMAENKFEDAAKIAHMQLGLSPEMQSMCSMFENEKFKTLGFAFHQSGDDLGDALQTRDVNASLRALNKTMGYCVECHATYRQ